MLNNNLSNSKKCKKEKHCILEKIIGWIFRWIFREPWQIWIGIVKNNNVWGSAAGQPMNYTLWDKNEPSDTHNYTSLSARKMIVTDPTSLLGQICETKAISKFFFSEKNCYFAITSILLLCKYPGAFRRILYLCNGDKIFRI